MQVPDRIILTGQDHHLGTTALPRELQLENIVNPPDPEQIRIMTPPRSITLRNSPFDGSYNSYGNSKGGDLDDETLIVENNQARFMSSVPNGVIPNRGGMDGTLITRMRDTSQTEHDDGDMVQMELEHLRDQLTRLSVRLLAVEDEVNASKERENYILIGALVYITLHACHWLFRSNR